MTGMVLPDTLAAKIQKFLTDKKTGEVVVYITNGSISSYRIVEQGRVARTVETESA